jgi:SpoVK/Ycf46/Vps4 family AAA+-type ATPase
VRPIVIPCSPSNNNNKNSCIGTGKTTICKGLAQKTFIRNADRFSSGMLLEVNSHSLFSKWFSESGKLVMKLFSHISEIAEDEQCMVVVLIDEVESITASRGSAARSNEPGDAVRVVNAVLTSLDALKRRPNVLVLCTSNLIASVDPVGILCYDTYLVHSLCSVLTIRRLSSTEWT